MDQAKPHLAPNRPRFPTIDKRKPPFGGAAKCNWIAVSDAAGSGSLTHYPQLSSLDLSAERWYKGKHTDSGIAFWFQLGAPPSVPAEP